MLKGQFYKKLGAFDLDVSLRVGNKELLVILGASGCGKSTLLNCIAGFMDLDQGYVELDKRVFSDKASKTQVPIHERQIAYIQQGKILFPHLTVKENILYSVKKSKWADVTKQYKDLLTLLDIEAYENRRPSTLSGGQQQRVAIARALMMSPKLILWDEPFSALDHLIREELRQLVLTLKEKLSIPMIFVTHDLEEAFQLSDRLAVMEKGRILQEGNRDQVFNSPVKASVGKILGITNILTATYTQEASRTHIKAGRLITFKCDDITLKGVDIDERLKKTGLGAQVQIGIRPEQILYVREDVDSLKPLAEDVGGNIFDATVLSISKHLGNYRLKISLKGLKKPLMMDMPRGVIQRYDIYEGSKISVLLKYKRLIVMNVVREPSTELHESSLLAATMKDKQENHSTINKVAKSQSQRERDCLRRYLAITGLSEKNEKALVIGIAGVSNSGKTTLVTQLITELTARGHRIGTIKHDGHGFDIDHPEKDTYRHRAAGAKTVAIASKDQYALIHQTDEGEVALEDLIQSQEAMDIVLVEGYKFSSLPKFEIIRAARSREGVCRKESLLGYVTDIDPFEEDLVLYGLKEIKEIADAIEYIKKEVSHER